MDRTDTKLDAAALMARAQEQTGLSQFGEPSFKRGLEALLEFVRNDPKLPEKTVADTIATSERRLRTRLRVEDWYRQNPGLAALELGGCTSVTGLPRTGTTALINVLSLDPRFRPLRNWEQMQPCPPPVLQGEAGDPRRLAALAALEALKRDNPTYAAMHLSDVDATEEDFELLGLSFHAQLFTLPCFAYHAWWRDADLRGTFAFHRRVTALLQSRRPPNHWLFKAPAHEFHLEALFSGYPGTKVIMTHRDPAKAVVSTLSLVSTLWPPGQDFDPAAFGAHFMEHLRVGAIRSIEARRRLGEAHFLDVHHHDFVAEPLATLDRIYAFLGMPFDPEVRSRMADWLEKNRSGTFGSHKYKPEDFGLRAEAIREAFSPYMARFGVRPEA